MRGMNWERRLPPLAEDALDLLSAAAEDESRSTNGDAGGNDGRSRVDFTNEEATAILVADEDFTEGDADYALEVLSQRGHIYSVDGDIRLTPTDD